MSGISPAVEPEPTKLARTEKAIVFGMGVFLIALLLGSFVLMTMYPQMWGADSDLQGKIQEDNWSALLYLSALGGIFGGAGRTLSTLGEEVGGSGRRPKGNIRDFIDRWFLYVTKPFTGAASGVLFLLAINIGLVLPLTGSSGDNKRNFTILTVIFISSVGGIFYEEVFSILKNLMRTIQGGSN